ncbi:hypothetical protein ACIQFZ_21580 [Streptomyces sp. NPDC093064]|uniref:hypothetical protein n=1 Tax=Streptomyces sp. NPDC093064 TaxID=3366020 RepID=UPI0038256027
MRLLSDASGSAALEQGDAAPVVLTHQGAGRDLPGYAGHQYGYYKTHPQIVRPTAWRQLERPEYELPQAIHDMHKAKVDQITQAWEDRRVFDVLPAAELRDLSSCFP